MVSNTIPESKKRERKELERLMKEFLEKGGKIKKIKTGKCDYWDKNRANNKSIVYGRGADD